MSAIVKLARQLSRCDYNLEISIIHLANLQQKAFLIRLKFILDSITSNLPLCMRRGSYEGG